MKNNKAILIVAILFAVVSLWQFWIRPATWFDEGLNIGIAQGLVESGVYSLSVEPGEFVEERSFLITTNYPVLLPVALSIKLFGNNFMAARAPMILFLWMFVLMVYILSKKLHGKKCAIYSVLLTITFLPLYGNGKAVLGEVPGLLFFISGLYIVEFFRTKYKYIIAGLLFGLSIATKPFFVLVLPALLIALLISDKTDVKFIKRIWHICVGLFLPMLFWGLSVLPEWSIGGIKTTIGYYANSYAESSFLPLVLSNIYRFISESTPIHFMFLFLIIFWALAKVWKDEKKLKFSHVAIVSFIVFNILWYIKTPGWYRYFFPSHLLLFIIFPWGLYKVISKKFATVIFILLLISQSILLIKQSNSSIYLSFDTENLLQYVENNVPKHHDILLINSPSANFVLSDFNTYQYLQINKELHFGVNNIVKEHTSRSFAYLIVGSGLGNVKIDGLFSTLDLNYNYEKNIGKYRIYKANKYGR